MKISIIIPTYQEEDTIADLVRHIFSCSDECLQEVIVSDGGSSDRTLKRAAEAGARALECPRRGRGSQLNYGAEVARGDIFYFLHADAFPPPSFLKDIVSAIDLGYDFGNFRQTIQSDNPLVKINSWASRFNGRTTSGGDQSLFISRQLFERLGGYREDYIIMEDYEFYARARVLGEGIKIPKYLMAVDRKYAYNSFLRVNISNIIIFLLYSLGVHPNKLYPLYKKWIKGPRYSELE